jgi:hypothetical protein
LDWATLRRGERWVYYCVDHFGEWPALDGPTLRSLERIVIERADLLIAVSDSLREKLRPTDGTYISSLMESTWCIGPGRPKSWWRPRKNVAALLGRPGASAQS